MSEKRMIRIRFSHAHDAQTKRTKNKRKEEMTTVIMPVRRNQIWLHFSHARDAQPKQSKLTTDTIFLWSNCSLMGQKLMPANKTFVEIT